MLEPKIRDRLVGGWRLTGYEVTVGGKTDHPLGDDPLGMILYTPDGYMSAQLAGPGPYEDEDSRTPTTSHIPGRMTSTKPARPWLITCRSR
jgi:hypothetical protein